jgi:[ribosomal protein S5]-alanine N-acetyltransferase
MNCILRKWRLSDAKDLAAALSNDKILNNLRDGLPFLGRKKFCRRQKIS